MPLSPQSFPCIDISGSHVYFCTHPSFLTGFPVNIVLYHVIFVGEREGGRQAEVATRLDIV